MLHSEFENRLTATCRENEAPLSMATPPKRRLINPCSPSGSPLGPPLSISPKKPSHGDRLTPSRLGAKWNINFQLMSGDSQARTEMKRARDAAVEGNKDTQMYLCMLRNELLGTEISDVRLCPPVGVGGGGYGLSVTAGPNGSGGVSNLTNGITGNTINAGSGSSSSATVITPAQDAERRILAAIDPMRLYHFRTPRSIIEPTSMSTCPYSISPLSNASQALLRSPRKTARKISKMPFKVLDAPELQDDFYLNLVDWSSQNVLAVGLGASVWLWFACTSQVTRLCDLSVESDSVTSVAWTEKGNLVAVGTHHGLVQIWDVTASKRINTIQGHLARVGALAWNGDTQICSGSRDRFIQQKDIRTPPVLPDRRLQGHRQEVCGLKWSPDNQYLASGGNDNKLHVWNLHSNQPVQTYGDHVAAVKAIAWSPHHHGLLASGGGTADRCIRFWNTLTNQAMQCVDTGSQVCNLAWSKHSSELVSTHGYSQNQILLWKYPSLVQVAKLTGHTFRVLYLAMSPCGESIVTGAGDETLRFWSVFSKARSPKQIRSALDPFANLR